MECPLMPYSSLRDYGMDGQVQQWHVPYSQEKRMSQIHLGPSTVKFDMCDNSDIRSYFCVEHTHARLVRVKRLSEKYAQSHPSTLHSQLLQKFLCREYLSQQAGQMSTLLYASSVAIYLGTTLSIHNTHGPTTMCAWCKFTD